jgi:hypothetical protein
MRGEEAGVVKVAGVRIEVGIYVGIAAAAEARADFEIGDNLARNDAEEAGVVSATWAGALGAARIDPPNASACFPTDAVPPKAKHVPAAAVAGNTSDAVADVHYAPAESQEVVGT